MNRLVSIKLKALEYKDTRRSNKPGRWNLDQKWLKWQTVPIPQVGAFSEIYHLPPSLESGDRRTP